MRLLILGGTQFFGRALARHARDLGHDVTCAARGVSGPFPGSARVVRVDRDREDGLAALAGEVFDAAVDLSRHPGQVRRALAALGGRTGHWTFVSTTSVYADTLTRGQSAETSPLLPPTPADVEHCTAETYGSAKVACETMVGPDAFICRAGLIIGPDDPTGRFGYWVTRLRRGGEVLVPEDPEDPVQVIDVRDLARWILHAACAGLTGRYDALGPPCTRSRFLFECAEAPSSRCAFTWVSRDSLEGQRIGTGSGPRSLPLPLPDAAGDNDRDVAASLRAGLTTRPLAQTARDTLAWLEATGGPVTGLTPDAEALALSAWHGR